MICLHAIGCPRFAICYMRSATAACYSYIPHAARHMPHAASDHAAALHNAILYLYMKEVYVHAQLDGPLLPRLLSLQKDEHVLLPFKQRYTFPFFFSFLCITVLLDMVNGTIILSCGIDVGPLLVFVVSGIHFSCAFG